MFDIPIPIMNHLLDFLRENRSLAYVLVDKDGCLLKWGGNLAAYGISNLQKGEKIVQKIFFLEGLLPLDDSPLFLPCMQTQYGICADVHVFQSKEGDWVLLLDATWDEIHISLIQQQNNNASFFK